MTDPSQASTTLREFLRTSGTMSAEDRMLVARQALLVLEQNYAHLPLKAARYAVNPLQRLRLLIARLSQGGPLEAEWRFHAELLDVFDSLRDLHTRYVLPEPFAKAVAFLPFRIKEFVADGARHFVVAPLREDGSSGTPAAAAIPATLPVRAEVTSWNGVPIARAVDVHAERMPGANPAARHARALDTFTVRALGFAGPPDEEFVLIQYVDLDGTAKETREAWRVRLPQPDAGAGGAPVEQAGPDLELDLEAARTAWLRTLLFAPKVVERINSGAAEVGAPGEIGVTREFAKLFNARVVPGLTPEVGHVRILSFRLDQIVVAPGQTPPGVEGFVNEFIRLLGKMPPAGVIVDIRGNPGGNPVMAELCLQALTARRIDSEPLQFICSPLNLALCRANEDFEDWLPSMEQAVETGAMYSAGVVPTPANALAAVPQGYIGPVVLLTDARVYSAADRFAAGFQDNGLGPVLGVDTTTGAGGANVWPHADLMKILADDGDSPYRALPAGTEIKVALRRTLRVGLKTGTPVEDFGVKSDEVHETTREDIFEQGVDLMAHAARLLAGAGPARRFEVTVDESADGVTARFEAAFVDRADVYVDGRPRGSVDLAGGAGLAGLAGSAAAAVALPGKPDEVRVEGFAGERQVAVRVFRRDAEGRLALVTKLVL